MSHIVRGYTLQPTQKTIWSFVQVISDDNFVGWGEFTIQMPRSEISEALHNISTVIVDSDFTFDGPRCGPKLQRKHIFSAIYTAIDQAVFDIEGQRQKKKIAQLLNSDTNVDQVTLYANINRSVVERSPDCFAFRAQEATSVGFRAIKIAPFDDLSPEICQTDKGRALLQLGADRIQAVRDAIGSNISLMVDCHWRMNEITAHQALDFLTESGVSWYECPLPETPKNIDSLVRLRAKANDRGMQLAGCETFVGWKDFAPFVEKSAYDVIMPDAKYVGGMHEIMRVTERAREHGVAVSLHNPSGPISHVVSLHIAAALGNGMPLEFQFNETPLFDAIAEGEIPLRTGQSKLPDKPGIGIGLIESELDFLFEIVIHE
jgi:galactonate dehydratase